MAGFDDIAKKARALLSQSKVQETIKDPKAEGVSDKIFDGVANAAKRVTGGKHDAKIDGARDAADRYVGTDDSGTGKAGTGDSSTAKHVGMDNTPGVHDTSGTTGTTGATGTAGATGGLRGGLAPKKPDGSEGER